MKKKREMSLRNEDHIFEFSYLDISPFFLEPSTSK